jgi:hypothetical protein
MLKRFLLVISLLLLAIFVLNGCSSSNPVELKASLGKEFTLPAGKTVEIVGEQLGIKFETVTADSRCPKGVTCIWAGEAKSQIIIYSLKNPPLAAALIELTESAVTEGYSQTTWVTNWGNTQKSYVINFRLEPYPEKDKTIQPNDYRLILKITKS